MRDTYNDPTKWASPGIWERPAFNLAKYQKRLDKVCGTSDGKPIVRLRWAWDKDTRDFYYTKWDALGRGIEGEHRYKYRAATLPLGNGDTVDIPPPRWILEQRYEPGQYWASWQASRYVDDTDGVRKDMRGEPPADGWYGFLWCVADHDESGECCNRVWDTRRATCWGRYKEPDEHELNLLRRAIQRRDADPYKYSPHEPLPAEAFAEINRAAFEQEAAEDRERQRHLDDVWHDFVHAHGWRAFEDSKNYKKLSHGRYHFMPGVGRMTETASGLLVPE